MKKAICITVLFALIASGCGFAAGGGRGFRLTQAAQADTAMGGETNAPAETDTLPPTDSPTPTQLPTPTGTPTPQMYPVVTFAQNANCRKGPGIRYYPVVSYNVGDTAEIDGRNGDGTWLWVRIDNDRDYCWAATSAVKDFGDANVLSVIPYQTLPDAPALISVTRKTCGGTNILRIEWADVTAEQGYRLYRNSELIGTFPAAVTFTLDYPRNAKIYVYAVEAYNEYGLSRRIAVSEPGC